MCLNVSKGNMYEFVTHTWNTVKGECYHDCSYCYMKRWGKQNPIRFDDKELKTDLGINNFIFVGSSNDLFSSDIPNEWIESTLNYCSQFGNQYLFQTKNPSRLMDYQLPTNSVVCTTIETNRYYPDLMGNCPTPFERSESMSKIELPKFITIEPIMDFDLVEMLDLIRSCNPVQVNIGADSGGNNLPEPSREKLLELIDGLMEFTTIEKKRNLNRLLKN